MISPEGREAIAAFRRDMQDDDHRDAMWQQMQRRIATESPRTTVTPRRVAIAIAIAIAAAVLLTWGRPEPRLAAPEAPRDQAAATTTVPITEGAAVRVVVPAELPSLATPVGAPSLPRPVEVQRPTNPSTIPSATVDPFAAEVALVRGAREAAVRGDWDAVATQLDRHAREFPDGKLRLERLTLAIDRLCARGELGRAAEAARRLVAAFPESPAARRRATATCPKNP